MAGHGSGRGGRGRAGRGGRGGRGRGGRGRGMADYMPFQFEDDEWAEWCLFKGWVSDDNGNHDDQQMEDGLEPQTCTSAKKRKADKPQPAKKKAAAAKAAKTKKARAKKTKAKANAKKNPSAGSGSGGKKHECGDDAAGPASFARRNRPTREFAGMRWDAIKAAFLQHIRPLIDTPTHHEARRQQLIA